MSLFSKSKSKYERRRGKEAIVRSVYNDDYERLKFSTVSGRVIRENGKTGRKLTDHEKSYAIGYVEGYEANKKIIQNINKRKGRYK